MASFDTFDPDGSLIAGTMPPRPSSRARHGHSHRHGHRHHGHHHGHPPSHDAALEPAETHGSFFRGTPEELRAMEAEFARYPRHELVTPNSTQPHNNSSKPQVPATHAGPPIENIIRNPLRDGHASPPDKPGSPHGSFFKDDLNPAQPHVDAPHSQSAVVHAKPPLSSHGSFFKDDPPPSKPTRKLLKPGF